MNKMLVVGLFFMSGVASAQALRCDVLNSNKPADWPKEYISVELNQYVEALSFVHQIPNPDGSFREKFEKLYGGTIRGGVEVTYCNPDNNEYLDSLGKINLSSTCSTTGTGARLSFRASLSTFAEGQIKVIITAADGSNIQRVIQTSACN